MKLQQINWTKKGDEYISDTYLNQFRFRIYDTTIINGNKLIKIDAIKKDSNELYSGFFIYSNAFSLNFYSHLDIMEIAYIKLCEEIEKIYDYINELLEEK